ncbi:MAG: MoaD family protein [Candidatus Bathyarchaeota archaeon]|nr:MAG: MoaD family protein [Candidatus Bathyarchaeota archaeon]
MKVNVRVFGEPVQMIGKRHTLELAEGATIITLTNKLAEKAGLKRRGYFGEYKVGGGDLAILVNGRNIELLDGVKTALRDGDEVVILIPTTGG